MDVNGTTWSSARSRAAADVERSDASHQVQMAPEEVLELLDDDHARAVLAAVTETERTAREIVGLIESSRATVYRRLNDLEAAGLVEVGMQLDDDGHHRELYRTVPSRLTVSIGSDGVALESVECAD